MEGRKGGEGGGSNHSKELNGSIRGRRPPASASGEEEQLVELNPVDHDRDWLADVGKVGEERRPNAGRHVGLGHLIDVRVLQFSGNKISDSIEVRAGKWEGGPKQRHKN